jgi:FAD:protein FMN transferase
MKATQILMDMPVTVEIVGTDVTPRQLDEVFDYFHSVDERFSTFKPNSEISQINQGVLKLTDSSVDMQTIFRLAETTRQDTRGYFDIKHLGKFDPSGIVKGWAILKASELIKSYGYLNYYVEAGGDIEVGGHNAQDIPWHIGIRHPFELDKTVKTVILADHGIATSGTYLRGQHIYNPVTGADAITDIISLTVIGPNVMDADRFATAAFAMGKSGIQFIESQEGFEGYMIDDSGQATLTTGFERYVVHETNR